MPANCGIGANPIILALDAIILRSRFDYNVNRFGYIPSVVAAELCRTKPNNDNMNIIVTGSLGNISKPLTMELVQKGHQVTVISSRPEKKNDIEALGAIAAIGSIEDIAFLTNTFSGADVIYTMLPPFMSKFSEVANFNAREEAKRLCTNYVAAIQASGVKRAIHLSSIGAHLEKGNGLLAFHFYAEQTLKQLPADVSLTFMRPVGFYYNLFDFIDIIKGEGFLKGFVGKIMALRFYGLAGLLQGKNGLIISNYGAEDKLPWVSPKDIAAAIAEEVEIAASGIKVRYVASDELTCNEVAGIIGEAIGKPYLKWGTISDKQLMSGLKQFNVPFDIAADITEMNASMRSGILFSDYYNNKPVLGNVKLKEFAKEFAVVYNQK
jgi:uncharacterized protein YbjT (DUF2867 family)